MSDIKQGETLTDAEMDELVEKIQLAAGLRRYVKVLGIWSTYVGMVFDEKRTKDKQSVALRTSLREQREACVADAQDEEKRVYAAAGVMAIDMVSRAVAQAFDFSTYSGAKRCAFIQKAIQEEIDGVQETLLPLQEILNDLLPEGEE